MKFDFQIYENKNEIAFSLFQISLQSINSCVTSLRESTLRKERNNIKIYIVEKPTDEV